MLFVKKKDGTWRLKIEYFEALSLEGRGTFWEAREAKSSLHWTF